MAIDPIARGMAAGAGGGGGVDVGIDAGTGIRFTGTDPVTIINTGVTAVTTPGDNDALAENGTIKVANPGAENSADRVHYVKVKGINNAAFKDVDTVINDTKATSTNVPTTKAVYDELEKKLEADLDTTAFTNDNDHVPSSKLVKEKLDDKLEDSLTINGVSYDSTNDSYTLDGDDIDLIGYTPISSGTEEDVAATDSVNDAVAKIEYKADNRIPTDNIDADFPVNPDATHVLASTIASATFKGTGTAGVDPKKGLVPAPSAVTGDETRYLKADGTWATPPNTEYSEGTGIDISNTGVITNTGVTDVSPSDIADPSIANGTFKVVQNGTEKYIPIKGLDDAAYKDVDDAITSGSTSANLPTTQAVADYVDDAVSDIDATDINLTSNYTPAPTASLPAASDPIQTAIGKLAKSVDANQNSISLLGADISFTINSSTYELTARLLNSDGDAIGTAKTVDLPLESMVVDADYDDTNKTIVLTLKNGQTTSFSVADLVSGLQTELSSDNKLNPDYIAYDASHRAVSDTEKGTWNGKQDVISDLATIRSGAAAGATAVQPSEMQTALSTKQDSLDNTQLAAVNSGINSTKVGQIETNKTNILYNLNMGVKNILTFNPNQAFNGSISTQNGVTCKYNGDGTYTLNGTATANTTFVINLIESDKNKGNLFTNCRLVGGLTDAELAVELYDAPWTRYSTSTDTDVSSPINAIPANVRVCVFIRAFSGKSFSNQIMYPMICTLDAWNQSPDCQPPALPNYDLTRLEAEDRASLAEVMDSGAKNKFIYDEWNGCAVSAGIAVYENNGVTLTSTGNDCFTVYTSSEFPADARITGKTGETIVISWDYEVADGVEGQLYIFPNAETIGMVYGNIRDKKVEYTFTSGISYITFRCGVRGNGNVAKWKNVMVCTKAAFGVSQKFVPFGNDPFYQVPINHNMIYRGRNLGASLTDAQHTALSSGNFTDLYLGDYWTKTVTIPAGTYTGGDGQEVAVPAQTNITLKAVIADFDTFYAGYASTYAGINTHHAAVIVTGFSNVVWNKTNSTAGGYVASLIHKWLVGSALPQIETWFGSAKVLSHQKLLTNAITGDAASGWAWSSQKISLLSENQMYGSKVWGNSKAANGGYEPGEAFKHLNVFNHIDANLLFGNKNIWLRDIASAGWAADLIYYGDARYDGASATWIAPAALILLS